MSVIGSIAWACADAWWPEYGTSNFTPEAFVDTAYSPFFVSENFYYGIGHDEMHDKRFNESNTEEWTKWFENKVPAGDIEYALVYEDFAGIDSATSYLYGKLKQLPASLRSSKLFTTKNPKTADFIKYLFFAKQAEVFALNHADDWSYDASKKPKFNASKFNPDLLQQFTTAKDNFLKERYWFQLVRSYFFNSSAQNTIDAFEKNKDGFQKNKIYYRTMAYAAGGYYKLKNFAKANYYYSLVYDGCNEMKTVAHYSFHPQEEKDWKATLALCQSKDEQATLWQMLGTYYSDEKRAINEIYKLNPKSEKLDLLLSRAVNKEEQRFVEWQNDQPRSRANPSVHVNAELFSLVNSIAAAANTAKPHAWYMAAGYLCMLNKDYTKAQSQYALAEKVLPKNKLPQFQLRMLKLLNKIAPATTIDSKLENEVLSDIDWLTGLGETSAPGFRYSDAKAWLLNIMAARYAKQKELVKAECFHSTSNFYASNANVEAFKSFIDKPNKTPYENLCIKLAVIKKPDLLEYQAVRLAFDDKLAEAIVKMQEGTDANRVLLGNPFNGRIQDCHDCDHEAAQKIKYTRLELLKKMKEMEDKVNAGEDVYSNSVLLANAFYNMTHYGNARYFYEGKIIGSGQSHPSFIDSVFRGFITDIKQASKYYSKALQTAKTDEQKAKCYFMLAKCERNQWYNAVYSKENYAGPDFKAWEGFKSLRQYSNTQYYKDVIKECGYFKTYTNK